MKKVIAILIVAGGLYLWLHRPVAEPIVVKMTAPAIRSSTIVVAPASRGGLDGNGNWEFKSNVSSAENAQTDLTLKRNW